MAGELEFEKPVIELRAKIDELKKFTQNSEMDLSAEIERLETRLSKLEADIYTNLKPLGQSADCSACDAPNNSRLHSRAV